MSPTDNNVYQRWGGALGYGGVSECDDGGVNPTVSPWGGALGSDLRMACGGSSDIVCNSKNVDRLWSRLNGDCDISKDVHAPVDPTCGGIGMYGTDTYVADAFVDTFSTTDHEPSKQVALCIAHGGSEWAQSPLSDTQFTSDYNGYEETYLYLEYFDYMDSVPMNSMPVHGGRAESGLEVLDDVMLELPQELPSLDAQPGLLPELFAHKQHTSGAAWDVYTNLGDITNSFKSSPLDGISRSQASVLHFNHAAGSFSLSGDPAPVIGDGLSKEDYIKHARNFVTTLGLTEPGFDKFRTTVARIMLSRRKPDATGPVGAGDQKVKEAIVTFRQKAYDVRVGQDSLSLPMLGDGGFIEVKMHSDGTLSHLTKVWRRVSPFGTSVPVMSRDDAIEAALQRVPNRTDYAVDRVRFGYKQLALDLPQSRMSPVYEVLLKPLNDKPGGAPPLDIDVDAQAGTQ